MPYVPGATGLKKSITEPDIIPTTNFAFAVIELPRLVPDVNRDLFNYITKYGGDKDFGVKLAARTISISDWIPRSTYAKQQVYGGRYAISAPKHEEPGTITLQFLETRKPSARDFFLLWRKTWDDFSGKAIYYDPPKMSGRLTVYYLIPDLSAIDLKIMFYNVYPESISNDAIAGDVSATDLSQFNISLRYVAAVPCFNPKWDPKGLYYRDKLFPSVAKC